MIQAIILGVFGLIAIYIAISQFENLKQIHKVGILLFSILLFVLFGYIEVKNEEHQSNIAKLQLKFNSGKTVVCRDINVSNSDFLLTSNSFIAKKESENYGLIVPLTDCFGGK